METFTEARQRYSREADALVSSATEPETKRTAEQLARQRLVRQLGEFRRTLVQSSEDERSDMLRILKSAADEAKQLASLYSSPVAFLSRMALGETRRLNLQQTLAEAGPVELEGAARQAIFSNDLPLAAAVATVVDRRPKDRRPFAAGDFAARMVGATHTELMRKLKAVRFAFEVAYAAEKEFVSGKVDPLRSVSLAIGRRQATASEQAARA